MTYTVVSCSLDGDKSSVTVNTGVATGDDIDTQIDNQNVGIILDEDADLTNSGLVTTKLTQLRDLILEKIEVMADGEGTAAHSLIIPSKLGNTLLTLGNIGVFTLADALGGEEVSVVVSGLQPSSLFYTAIQRCMDTVIEKVIP